MTILVFKHIVESQYQVFIIKQRNYHSKPMMVAQCLLGFTTFLTGAHATCFEHAPKPVNIMFFQPEETRSQFWFNSMRFAKAVAKDLDITLNVIEISGEARNRFTFKELTSHSLANHPRPDFILSIFYGGGEFAQLDVFNKTGIPFFTFNTSLDTKILALTRQPRDRFENWKGHRSPNEIQAGGLLARELRNISGGDTLAILAGPTESRINSHRVDGASQQGINDQVTVIPPINTDWKEPSSSRATQMLVQRVPDFDMLWTAGPDIAKGAIDELSRTQAVQSRQVAIGTFDWTTNNVKLIQQGLLDVAYGGHFMDAGWAMVMIFDYLHGIDFVSDPGTLVLSELARLDSTNVSEIEPLVVEDKWHEIDFRRYSKCHNPNQVRYDFSLLTK